MRAATKSVKTDNQSRVTGAMDHEAGSMKVPLCVVSLLGADEAFDEDRRSWGDIWCASTVT